MRHTIEIQNVKIQSRMRKELGNLDMLADSIRRNGLIQPIVLTPSHTLVAGERRLRACQQLGLQSIDYVYVKEVTPDVQAEMEFEENYWRKSMTWQENALGILNIYRKKKRQGALEGFQENWHYLIADMFGMAIGTVNYILLVAKKLEKEKDIPEEKRRFWNFQSANEAYRLGILADVEDAKNLELAEKAKRAVATEQQQIMEQKVVQEVAQVQASPDALKFEREKYESNKLNTVPFDVYWAEKVAKADEIKNTIHISNRFFQVNCIDFMLMDENRERFDHIITDPPYAIDMDNLTQQDGGMNDVDRVEDEHEVDYNIDLLTKFFPAAFQCTKEKSFLILCCDLSGHPDKLKETGSITLWDFLTKKALDAGWLVQRWPYIWQKVNQPVMNNCAMYNTTKDYEPVMICRKPSSVLAAKRNTSFTAATNTRECKVYGHPFSKPSQLVKDLCGMVSMEGQHILEPFAGGGSVVVPMLEMKRNVIALEKKDIHFNSMVENVKREYYLKLNPKFVFK